VKDQRILELDVLRGIAALMVAIAHLTLGNTPYDFTIGPTAVNLFFIISGFVIFLSIKETKKWQNFVIARIARLYPAYLTAICLTTFFTFLFGYNNITKYQFIINLSMLEHFFKVKYIDGSYWTLIIELFFYVIIFFLYVLRLLKNIELIGFASIILIFIFHIIGPQYFYKQYNFIVLAFPFINYFYLFYIGILFYLLKQKGHTYFRHFQILLCFLAFSYCCEHYAPVRVHSLLSKTSHIFITGFYISLFYLFIFNKLTFIINKLMLFLGSISYSLYLLNQTIGNMLINYLTNKLNFNMYLAIFFAFGLVTILATLITYKIERPVIMWAKKFKTLPIEAI